MTPARMVKLLLRQLNKQGQEASLITVNKYSEQFDSISSYYKLTFWKKVTTNVDGEEITRNIADTHEFKNVRDLVKYMGARVR